MREVTDVKRYKKIINIQPEEIVKGEWLKIVKDNFPINDKLEIVYKNHFMTITGVDIKSVKEEKKNGTRK